MFYLVNVLKSLILMRSILDMSQESVDLEALEFLLWVENELR